MDIVIMLQLSHITVNCVFVVIFVCIIFIKFSEIHEQLLSNFYISSNDVLPIQKSFAML